MIPITLLDGVEESTSAEIWTLDIGGNQKRIGTKHLKTNRSGRLRALVDGCRDAACLVDFDRREAFFDVGIHFAEAVLEYCRTGHLHLDSEMCAAEFWSHVDYWAVDIDSLEPCCKSHIGGKVKKFHSALTLRQNRSAAFFETPIEFSIKPFLRDRDPFTNLRFAAERRHIWHLLEDPGSSRLAFIWNAVSILFVLISMTALVLGSMPQLQRDKDVPDELKAVDAICVAWFTMEYLLRLAVAPNRTKYVCSPFAMIDLAAVLPFYVELAIEIIGTKISNQTVAFTSMKMIRIFRLARILRVLRLLKVVRYSSSMQTFGKTLSLSYSQLSMMLLMLIISCLAFSTIMYFIECDEKDTKFISIPAASWWCVVSMTTLGYGDMTPTTTLGRVVGTVAVLAGIIIVVAPLSTIVQNFDAAQREIQGEDGNHK